MNESIDINAAYIPSEQIVAREIRGEIILVPITAGVGDMEDELYTLNDTGRVIWQGLGKQQPLRSLVDSLSKEYDAPFEKIESGVTGLLSELIKRNMVVKVDLG